MDRESSAGHSESSGRRVLAGFCQSSAEDPKACGQRVVQPNRVGMGLFEETEGSERRLLVGVPGLVEGGKDAAADHALLDGG